MSPKEGAVSETEDDFSVYIERLSPTLVCKHHCSLMNVVDLCDNPSVGCSYRTSETYTQQGIAKFVCQRAEILKARKILGVK